MEAGTVVRNWHLISKATLREEQDPFGQSSGCHRLSDSLGSKVRDLRGKSKMVEKQDPVQQPLHQAAPRMSQLRKSSSAASQFP
jgi:hypothetical protein